MCLSFRLIMVFILHKKKIACFVFIVLQFNLDLFIYNPPHKFYNHTSILNYILFAGFGLRVQDCQGGRINILILDACITRVLM